MTTSVIIPLYNEERTIKLCIGSLLTQTLVPDQIIIVDNNSTDQSAKIAASYPEINLITETKQGASAARLAGFKQATGDIILFTDADSIPALDWVEKITAPFTNKNIIAVSGKVQIRMPDESPHPINESFYWRVIHPWMYRLGRPMFWGANIAIRRNVLKTTYFATQLHASSDFYLGRQLAKYKKFNQKIIYEKSAIVTAYDTPSIVPKRTKLDHFLAEMGIFRKKLHKPTKHT